MKKTIAVIITILMLTAVAAGCVQQISDAPEVSVQPTEQTQTTTPEQMPEPSSETTCSPSPETLNKYHGDYTLINYYINDKDFDEKVADIDKTPLDPYIIIKTYNDFIKYCDNMQNIIDELDEMRSIKLISLKDIKKLYNKDFFSDNTLIVVNCLTLKFHEYYIKDVFVENKTVKIKIYIEYIEREERAENNENLNTYYIPVNSKDITEVDVELMQIIPTPAVPKKPIIYLYPKEKQDVNIVFGKPENLAHTYPKYNNGWNVTAFPNGDLIDKNTNRSLYSLYWEGKDIFTASADRSEGFVVNGEDTIPFLEEKLAILGLNEREANEFIIYWLPQLEVNKYNFIRFQTMEEINSNMPLAVTPAPDTIIRVMMEFAALNEEITVKEQILETPKRNGFVVVEWGGMQIK